MIMKRIFSALVVVTLLTSCVKSYLLSIDVRKAAPITFSQDVKRIAVVDNSFVMDRSRLIKSMTVSDSLVKAVYDTLRPVLLKSFTQYMNAENVFDTVKIYPYHPKSLYLYKEAQARGQTELPLTKDEIIDICTKAEADILISLDYIDASSRLWVPFSTLYPKEERDIRTIISTTMRVYSNDGNIIAPVKHSYSTMTYLSKGKGLTKELKKSFAECAEWIADLYVNSFIPRWLPQDRRYYPGLLNSYDDMARKSRESWSKSITKWTEAYNKEKPKKREKRAKYASNIALAYEYTDDIDSALKWINIARSELPPNDKGAMVKDIEDYKEKLERRQSDAPLIRKQLKLE